MFLHYALESFTFVQHTLVRPGNVIEQPVNAFKALVTHHGLHFFRHGTMWSSKKCTFGVTVACGKFPL